MKYVPGLGAGWSVVPSMVSPTAEIVTVPVGVGGGARGGGRRTTPAATARPASTAEPAAGRGAGVRPPVPPAAIRASSSPKTMTTTASATSAVIRRRRTVSPALRAVEPHLLPPLEVWVLLGHASPIIADGDAGAPHRGRRRGGEGGADRSDRAADRLRHDRPGRRRPARATRPTCRRTWASGCGAAGAAVDIWEPEPGDVAGTRQIPPGSSSPAGRRWPPASPAPAAAAACCSTATSTSCRRSRATAGRATRTGRGARRQPVRPRRVRHEGRRRRDGVRRRDAGPAGRPAAGRPDRQHGHRRGVVGRRRPGRRAPRRRAPTRASSPSRPRSTCGSAAAARCRPRSPSRAGPGTPRWPSRTGATAARSTRSRRLALVLDAVGELRDEWRARPDKTHPHLSPGDIVPTVISRRRVGRHLPVRRAPSSAS